MTNNIRFKIIAGKINTIPEFHTIFVPKMPHYIIRQRDWGQAKAKYLRLRPKLQGRDQNFVLEATWGLNINALKVIDTIEPKNRLGLL